MYLTYDDTLKAYLFVCSYYEKDTPKSLGFQWNPAKTQGRKVWFTTEIDVAMEAAKYADEKVKSRFHNETQRRASAIEKSYKQTTDKKFKAPKGLKYYPFQAAGIEYLVRHKKVLLSDFLGGGKTIQVIGLINNSDIRKVLIICPNTIKLNWKIELEKWLRKNLSISVIYAQEYVESDIMIINYDILNRYATELSKIKFNLVVADESVALKNEETQRFKAYKLISKNIPRKIFITGTPILSRPAELWTTIQEICPDEFGTKWEFYKKFCGAKQVRIGYDREKGEPKYAWDYSGASNLELLQTKLRSSCMIRRFKKDVLQELPEVTRQIILLDDSSITKDEEEQLKEVKEDYISQVEHLRANSLGTFEILSRIRHETALKKVPYVVEFVKNILESEEKVIVFAHHQDVISLLKVDFPNSVVIMGDTPTKERQKAIDLFQFDPEIRVFIGSIQASGVGITLTASSTVVFAELDWIPANITQCEARACRIGQKNAVNSYHLVVNGTIDAHLAKTIIRKQEIVDAVLNNPVNYKKILSFGA